MRKIDKSDIEFLKGLQEEIKTQDTDSQASPRFWVLRDYEWQETTDGYYNRISIFLPVKAESYELKEIVSMICEGELGIPEEHVATFEYMEPVEDNVDSIFEWIQDNVDQNARIVYEESVAFVVPNTFFLTKREAKEHIKANHYHYTDKVHTYGMTAWRSPQVERLFKILEEVEWE